MSNYKIIPTLEFADAIKLASHRLLDFSGRSRRSEFWFWMLIIMIVNYVVSKVLSVIPMVSALAQILVMCFGLSATARRLHDVGKSAIWVYLSFAFGIMMNMAIFIPGAQIMATFLVSGSNGLEKMIEEDPSPFIIIGLLSLLFSIVSLIVVIFCCLDGKREANEYGESPKYIADEAEAE